MDEMKIIAVVVAAVLVVSVIAGYLIFYRDGIFNSDEEEEGLSLSHEYSTGDSWTYEEDDEKFGNMRMTFTVDDDDTSFQGHDVYEMSMTLTVDNFEDEDGYEYRDFSGSGTAYDNGITYRETNISGEISPPDQDIWYDFAVKTETEVTTTGTIPDKVEVGDTFSITRTEESTAITYLDGEKIEENQSTEIQQRSYEVEGVETVTVEAGDFECVKLSWTGDEEHGTTYYSAEVKREVQEVTHQEDGSSSTTELLSYNVS